ncbi:MAG: hypothetical protein OSB70_01460 [Myxococcota bacterium]|nr:hypothetical protein [Myxococcota bacterium]
MRSAYLLAAAFWWAGWTLFLAFPSEARADEIDLFVASWAGRALSAQRALDLEVPMAAANRIGTHNAFNSGVYTTPTSYLDPNQVDSIYNQLRVGARAIELDVHWTPKAEGVFSFPNRLLLCHATAAHFGCSTTDRYLAEGLDEINVWLNSSASHDQVLLLHLEDHMDGQHGEAYNQIASRFGNLVYSSGGCGDLPGNLTKADVLAAGKKVLIWNEGGCSGDGNWNGMVFTGLGSLSRVWEDSTTLGGIGGAGASISASDVTSYFANGTNIVDLDQLHQNDARLPAAIWSWEVNEPNDFGGSEDCASQVANGRWNDDACSLQNFFACQHAGNGSWAISALNDIWQGGVSACASLGSEYEFGRPSTSQENQALKQARESVGQSRVWINHNDLAVEGDWQKGSVDAATFFAGQLTLLGAESVAGTSRLLELGADCNLQLFSLQDGVVGGILWSTHTQNQGINCRVEFQADGNLVLYEGEGQVLWASESSGTSGAQLHIQGDGNLVVYNGSSQALWQSYTNYPLEYHFAGEALALFSSQILHSQNRKIEMLTDCNLVLYSFENGETGGVVWHSDTAGLGSDCSAKFQADGNFVVYSGSETALWASGTSGTTGGILSLQEDGNLVVYNGVGQPLWSAGSNVPSELIWNAGQFNLGAGQWVQSLNRRLIMQEDCNLVLLNVENAIVGGPLWNSGTAGLGSDCELHFQADGNLVVYDGLGQPRWNSGTSGTSGAQLKVQADGNMVLYNGVGEPLWATFTPGTYPNTWACGDFSCNGDETCSSCAVDCGVCSGGGGGGVPVPLLSERGLVLLLIVLAGATFLRGVRGRASG